MVGRDTGDGSLARTRRTIEEVSAGAYVTIIEGVPRAKVALLLDESDVFLNTTQVDNTPVSVLEALACGLCVVTTNVGGIPYLVENGTHALLVPPADPESMAEAARSILRDKARARLLSEQGAALSRTFALDDVARRWNSLLEDVVHQGPSALHPGVQRST
jgi:glycosyltransferase involved in cell wall biosynthesis